MPRNPTRRKMLATIAGGLSSVVLAPRFVVARQLADDVPLRTITSGPLFHWFGYYDKFEFDLLDRFVLANQVDFQHRTPQSADQIRVGMVDTAIDDHWIELGSSTAWGWQQGCMLQWRPGTANEVVWNDRDDERYVCRVRNIDTETTRTLPRPIYSLSPDGRWAVTADFARIQRMRPGYGYVGLSDPDQSEMAPNESGIWRMDMQSGESQLIMSLADVIEIGQTGERDWSNQWNYFNHLLIGPDGKRLIVLHRWRASTGAGADAQPTGGFRTRMLTMNLDGSDPWVLDDSGTTSHFIWRDPQHVCAWSRPADRPAGFYLFRDQTNQIEPVAAEQIQRDGHVTYLPETDNQWILCDTYPDRETRNQTVFLVHLPSNRRVDLGAFHSPPEYSGEWRCDTHPRSNRDGRTVAIDSPHTGAGRQVHLLDIRSVIDG